MATERTSFRERILSIDSEASVVLASKRLPIAEVMSITPGAMIAFEKGHDEPITLCLGNREIATGETVKVGDKFGMRIREILAAEPKERSSQKNK